MGPSRRTQQVIANSEDEEHTAWQNSKIGYHFTRLNEIMKCCNMEKDILKGKRPVSQIKREIKYSSAFVSPESNSEGPQKIISLHSTCIAEELQNLSAKPIIEQKRSVEFVKGQSQHGQPLPRLWPIGWVLPIESKTVFSKMFLGHRN